MKKISLKEKLIGKIAESMVSNLEEAPVIAPVTKILPSCRVALITTAGVHLKNQEPFNTKEGDYTYRVIPDTVSMADIMITHGHYDQRDADKDINCVFPIERLHALKNEGFIGSTAQNHFGFMGYIPNTKPLIEDTAPLVAKMLKEDRVDIVILSPG